ncbi:MAG: lipid-A-disaccharide synthase [Bacteroidia bacterium]|nr:lipid-A-disaccharide synthase [Bacteroidia bacterium]
MNYYLIAGEASGDLHGADLILGIRRLDAEARFNGMGGDLMRKNGMKLTVHYQEYSFMGFWEVVINLRKIRSLLKRIKADILASQPDKVVLIDYGGFNTKIAAFCKAHGIETHFFILPKVWAWNEKRVKKLRAAVDVGYCIFPFEEKYFNGHGVKTHYVGNPVVHQVNQYLSENKTPDKQAQQVALLPGSRKQEVEKILPTMLSFASSRPELQFVIAAHRKALYSSYTLPSNVRIEEGDTFNVLRSSQLAIVTSGTATLETALLDVPQVVCYRANRLSFFIGKRVVKVRYISPVNLILDKLVIKELIQNEMNTVNLAKEVDLLLDEGNANRIRNAYSELRSVLGNKHAGNEAAQHIVHRQ